MALLRIQGGRIRQHADRAGNRSQGIADFVRDGSSQAADGSQAILHAHLAFQAADLGEVVKGINKAQVFRRAHVEGGYQDPKRLAEAVSGQVADFGIGPGDAEVGQRVLKNLGHGASAQLGFGDSEQLLGGAIDQRDAPVNPGGDDTSAHGLHDIFVEGLQILERPARILQLHIRLAKLAYQQTGKVSDGKVGKQVDEDYYLQRLQLGMGVRIRGHDAVIIEFEDGTEQDESQGGTEISPGSRQEHASDNDDQGVEKIQRAVDAAGDMNHQRDHGQIGEHLENGLEAVLAPDRNQKKEKQRKHEPEHHPDEEGQDGQRAGRKPDDGEFDGEQNQQDQDANLDQPGQPVSLIGDEGHVQRNNDAADADAEQADDDGFQHGQHVLGGGVNFVFVEVGNLLQHGVHGSGGFAHADHLGHHIGEDAAFAQGIDNSTAFFDRLAHLHQGFFEHGVTRGAGGNGQALENGNTGGNERAQGSGEAGDCDLAQQQANDG